MASNRGAPTLEQTKAFQKRAFESKTTPVAFTGYKKPTAAQLTQGEENNLEELDVFREVNSTQYPTRPIAVDSRDTKWDMKEQMQAAGLISAARPMPFTDAELDYVMDKASQEEFAAYDQWISDRYDLNDMATKTWFKQIYPSYFERRKAILEEQMKDHAKYARLVMDGPESEDDLFFQWTVESGRRHIPTGPFYDPFAWMRNETGPAATINDQLRNIRNYNMVSYNYGMFNPLKPETPSSAAWAANPLNQSDIVGNPNSRTYGFLGANVPVSKSWRLYGQGLNQPRLGRAEATFNENANNRAFATPQDAPLLNYGRTFVDNYAVDGNGAFEAASNYRAPTRPPLGAQAYRRYANEAARNAAANAAVMGGNANPAQRRAQGRFNPAGQAL